MYHGARGGFGFQPKGPSYFSSSESFSKTYGPTSEHSLCLQNPLEVGPDEWPNYASNPFVSTKQIAATVKKRGYDSVLYKLKSSSGVPLTVAFVVDAKKAIR